MGNSLKETFEKGGLLLTKFICLRRNYKKNRVRSTISNLREIHRGPTEGTF